MVKNSRRIASCPSSFNLPQKPLVSLNSSVYFENFNIYCLFQKSSKFKCIVSNSINTYDFLNLIKM